MSEFESRWQEFNQRTVTALKHRLASEACANRLLDAMAYSCLGRGKRFRAMLVYACGQMVGATVDHLDTPACAVEMVHAYSLIHDDLPAMDDDDLRRGQPTCHIAFDEATAILAGDALQSRAFEILSSEQWNPINSARRAKMVETLSQAIGLKGMAGGQSLDIEATDRSISYVELTTMHRLKTGALIKASALLGGLACTSVDDELLKQLSSYAQDIGLAFQITDDILDHTSDSATLGKEAGVDDKLNKSTYVSLLGIERAKEEAHNLSLQAIETAKGLGDNSSFLEQLAHFVTNRSF